MVKKMSAALLAAVIFLLSWGPASYSALAEEEALGAGPANLSDAAAAGPARDLALPDGAGNFELSSQRLDAELSSYARGIHELSEDPQAQEKAADYVLGRVLDHNADDFERSAGLLTLQALSDPQSVKDLPLDYAESLSNVAAVLPRGQSGELIEKINAALSTHSEAKDLKVFWDSFFAGSKTPKDFENALGTVSDLNRFGSPLNDARKKSAELSRQKSQEQVGTALMAMERLGYLALHPDLKVRGELALHLADVQSSLKQHLPAVHDELGRLISASPAPQEEGTLLDQAKRLWQELQEAGKTDEVVAALSMRPKNPAVHLGVNLGDLAVLIDAKEGRTILSTDQLRQYMHSFLKIAKQFIEDPMPETPILTRAAIFCAVFSIGMADFSALKPLTEEIHLEGPGWFYVWPMLLKRHFQQLVAPGLVDAQAFPLDAYHALRRGLIDLRGVTEADQLLLNNQRNIAKLHILDPLKANEIILELASLELRLTSEWLDRMCQFDGRLIGPLQAVLRKFPTSTERFRELLVLQSRHSFEELQPIYDELYFEPVDVETLIEKMTVETSARKWLADIKSKIADGAFPYGERMKDWQEADIRNLTESTLTREARVIVKADRLEDSFLGAAQGNLKSRAAYNMVERKILAGAARHNREIKRLFAKSGLNYETWTSWKNETHFEVTDSRSPEYLSVLVLHLRMQMQVLLGDMRNHVRGTLPWNAAKKVFNSTIKKWHLEKDISKGLFQFAKLGSLDAFVDEFNAAARAQGGPETALVPFPAPKKAFAVRLWKRRPARDLFQGNFTGSCIAFGCPQHDKTGVIENYLLDTGINIVEVVEAETGRTVAETFVYPVIHPDHSLSLVLDNIEIHHGYTSFNREIRDNLFAFARSYAEAVGTGNFKHVYLGVQAYKGEGTEPGVSVRIPGDDIPTKDLHRTTVTMSKFGGPLGETTYLDAFYRIKDRRHDGTMKTVPLFIVP